MAVVLGVSLSKEAASLALVEVAGGDVTVKDFWTFAYGEGELSLAQRAAFAAERTANLVLPRTPVAICLPGDEVYLRPQSVPFSKRSHIARTLAFEMEDKLPFELDSAVMDFVVTGHEGVGCRILVAAMRRTVLEGVMAPFDSRGLLVRLVTADVLCAGALGRLLGVSDYGLLQVDVAGWKLAVCRDRLLLFARGAPAAPAAASMEESLAGWVRQSMMAAPSGVAPQVLYVTGYEANALDCQVLSAGLALEVKKLVIDHMPGEKKPDASASIETSGARDDETELVPGPLRQPDIDPERSPPSGREEGDKEDAGERTPSMPAVLAAITLAEGGHPIDLLRAARGAKSICEVFFAPLAVGLALLAVLLGFLAWDSGRLARFEHSREKRLQESERAIWKSVFGEKKPPGGSVLLGLTAKVKEAEKAGGAAALGGDASWMMRAIHVLTRSVSDGPLPTFTRFQAYPDKLVVWGSSSQTTLAEGMAQRINDSGTFNAEVKSLTAGEGGKTTYEIVMSPKGEDDA